VQAFTHEAMDRARFGARVATAFAVARRRIAMRSALTGLVILLAFGGIALVLWIGGRDVLAGRISAGDLSAFVFYAVIVAMAVGTLSEVWGDVQRAAGAAAAITELLDSVADIRVPPAPVALPDPVRGVVTFEDVGFRYPASPDRSALQGFTIPVAPGETVALVGTSGAGKTTVFQLLLRFYDPQHGAVRIDGVDLRAADPAEVRKRIGLVPQDPVIFPSRRRAEAEAAVAEIAAAGGHVIAIQAGVADPDAVARMVVRTHRKLRFAGDSPLERDGFEPSVPRQIFRPPVDREAARRGREPWVFARVCGP
jgi:ATP-binding cassette, subfamily B, bacterial